MASVRRYTDFLLITDRSSEAFIENRRLGKDRNLFAIYVESNSLTLYTVIKLLDFLI